MRSSTKSRSRVRSIVGFVLLACLMLVPGIAGADILVRNWMEGAIEQTSSGPQIYAYEQGSQISYDSTAEFDLGTYVDTVADTGTGTHIRLAGAAGGGPDWWDDGWGSRRCFEIDYVGPSLSEHQVRLVIDTTGDLTGGLVQSDGADYRAIADDGITELDFWLESGLGTANTVMWVQLDIASGTTPFCLYFDNPVAASVSSQAAVFSYSAPTQPYYPLYWNHTGTSIGGQVAIVSYVDGNQVNVDGVTYTLNAGQVQTISGVTPQTSILASGPIGGRGLANGTDALVPARFAGTTMVVPTDRSKQRWTIMSPSGAAALVEVYDGPNLVATGTVGSTPISPVGDISANNAATIRSTNGVPILVTHLTTASQDSLVAPPWTGDDLYGVRSTRLRIGFLTSGSADVHYSNGVVETMSAGTGRTASRSVSTDRLGNGTAARITGFSGQIGAIQQADGNGFESSAFLPERLLDSEYYLPTAAGYVAIACPTQMTIDVGGVPHPCNPPASGHPGHAIAGPYPAGTRVASQSGEPFFAYYQNTGYNDEANLLGMKSAWRYSPEPISVTEVPAPTGPTSGTWTSPVIDTTTDSTNVFGLLTMRADIPDGATVSAQIARGDSAAAALAAPFVGPDGTSATSFDQVHNPIPHSWDFGSPYLVIRLTLDSGSGTASPTVDAVSLGYDLPEVHQSSTHTVVTTESTDTDWLLRIWTEDPLLTGGTANVALIQTVGVTALDSVTATLEGIDQFIVSSGSVVQWSGPDLGIGPGFAQSLAITTDGMAGTSLDATWQARLNSPSVLIPHQLHIDFS